MRRGAVAALVALAGCGGASAQHRASPLRRHLPRPTAVSVERMLERDRGIRSATCRQAAPGRFSCRLVHDDDTNGETNVRVLPNGDLLVELDRVP